MLTRLDPITVYVNVDEEMKKLIQKNKSQIKQIVRAKGISTNQEMPTGCVQEELGHTWRKSGARNNQGINLSNFY